MAGILTSLGNIGILIAALYPVFIVSFLVLASVFNFNLTGETVVSHEETFTKAICDDNNLCQDYEIVCMDDEVISAQPITGAIIQQSEDWEDSRKNKSEFICE